ncbi:hypothetical protein [Bosea sp. BK604]|uniref:hypothetical protein n=1 Tax=Bosea sp. BK604 TaxID=2512180 RepID=UPI00105206BE|nr:hypothetical protein [Bosea sp. BK604]
MYHSNRRNFEGLDALAEELRAHPRLRLLGDYCGLRSRGLRRQALAALEQFLKLASEFDGPEARAAAVDILELHDRTKEAHQFLAQPLRARFLFPVLETWMEDEPGSITPLRWLGFLKHSDHLLARALAMAPDDLPVRRRLVERTLHHINYATHHLDENFFIGSVDETVEDLKSLGTYIEGAPDPVLFAAAAGELRYFEALVADWIAFSREGAGSFPAWCAERKRKYRFAAKYDYGSS